MGGGLLGHEEHVKAAGGRVLAAHREIGVVTAASPQPDFASKLGSLDARLVSVRRLVHALRDGMGVPRTPQSRHTCKHAPCAEYAQAVPMCANSDRADERARREGRCQDGAHRSALNRHSQRRRTEGSDSSSGGVHGNRHEHVGRFAVQPAVVRFAVANPTCCRI